MKTPKEQLLNKSDQELKNEIESIEQELAQRRIDASKDGEVVIKIEDFMNPEVKPFACGFNLAIEKVPHYKSDGIAIYSVYNFTLANKEPDYRESDHRAGMILNLFGKDSEQKINFMNKTLGDVYTLNHFGEQFRIKFKQLEKRIPKGQLNEWAKKLGKKPEEILIGNPREYYNPMPVIVDEEAIERELLMKERKLRLEKDELELREKEIELREREAKLKKEGK
jgi:hypothetical protein